MKLQIITSHYVLLMMTVGKAAILEAVFLLSSWSAPPYLSSWSEARELSRATSTNVNSGEAPDHYVALRAPHDDGGRRKTCLPGVLLQDNRGGDYVFPETIRKTLPPKRQSLP